MYLKPIELPLRSTQYLTIISIASGLIEYSSISWKYAEYSLVVIILSGISTCSDLLNSVYFSRLYFFGFAEEIGKYLTRNGSSEITLIIPSSSQNLKQSITSFASILSSAENFSKVHFSSPSLQTNKP